MSDAAEAGTRAVLAEVNDQDATSWGLRRRLSGGFQSGAWLIESCHGRRAVLKWSTSREWAPTVLAAAPVVAAVRARGWPTPAWLSCGVTSLGFSYQVQEFVDGVTREDVSDEWLDLVLPVLTAQAGLASAGMRNWSDYDHAVVFDDPDGNRAAVAAAGPGGTAFDAAVTSVTEGHRHLRMTADDLVHGDFNPGNVLLRPSGGVSLIDVEALGRGTRLHDLSTVLLNAQFWGAADVVDRLIAAARAVHGGPGWFEVTLSAVAIDLLSFGVRHWPKEDLDQICRSAAELLLRVARQR